ncbi:MAG: leucine--tRNA ligase [Cryomorphaceae bacterium]|nr:leucine--tRNA ligase [Cryomorphaceae bacterium]MDG1888954.1 leucine--tRNA ligase [Flavobacteriaceae bacterium]MBT3504150.1 leucine--tRNA ligase [Cryomorphaceae bacterium]MBT3689010.1 leucine--tRNA ligase [Cryomorphaceae bacterium]MBT4222337.1 leucine--tRNA ligase [Cryomorphaceae bacterium]
MNYNFLEIEKKWQKFWKTNKTYKVGFSSKPKLYVLDMFPYPSGAGLHVGHPLGYIASDIYSRFKRHNGFNVLHPQGYDSFGLPAEQYAIKTGQHPKKTTLDNINMYRNQLDRIGFSFDWSREIRTSDPNYYKWTQWIFILMFNSFYCSIDNKAKNIENLISSFNKEGDKMYRDKLTDLGYSFNNLEWNDFNPKKKSEILMNFRLAYLTDGEVNWCEELGTVLANDEIINGVSERGGHPVTKRKVKHWCLRISKYSERLLNGLDKINWPDPLKEMQRNWIGKSKGVSINFKIENSNKSIEVFTTRPDTIFGVSFLTIAPEYTDISDLSSSENKLVIEKYLSEVLKKSERDRLSDVKTVSGVFSGSYAIHPFNGNKVPIWISDYVIASYGTGAVMGVPAGDQRDFDFAKKFQIDIPNIFKNIDISNSAFSDKTGFKLINSEFLDGKDYNESIEIIINEIENKNIGKSKIQYKLRDATFSRQRYWGEPIPIYYKDGIPQNIDLDNLPLKLPEVDNFLPTKNGDSPLGNSKAWAWSEKDKKVTSNDKINDIDTFPIELNTMPGWAGSSWYFYRYMDPTNNENFVSEDSQNYWSDIDVYFGGSEHATGHLLYSRFYQKFLYDLKFLNKDEYAKKLVNQGMILGNSAFVYRKSGTSEYLSKNLISDIKVDKIRIDIKYVEGEDHLNFDLLKKDDKDFKNSKFILEKDKFLCLREQEKMSKSKFNVVNPDEICNQYGADTLRMYEMFLGPIEQSKPWDTRGISGVHSFLKKFWNLFFKEGKINLSSEEPSKESLKSLHKTIKKVSEDIEKLSLNTCISSFMICINELSSLNCNNRLILEDLLVLISPFAPHFSEELWSQIGNSKSIVDEKYPDYEEKYLVESEKAYPVSFNGKTKFTLNLSLDLNHQEIEKAVLSNEKTKSILNNNIPKKIIIVPGKIINIVI